MAMTDRPAMLAWFGLALLLCLCTGVVTFAYQRDMRHAYERIGARGQVVASPLGDIEFVQGGRQDAATAVLLVHGSGGGWDQGELLARAALGEDTILRWIAPSRFGYLRSTFKPAATFDDQAHAYVHLLDHLGIKRVAVVALSHGGPSALLFAALHPERVSSLTLVSAGVAASAAAEQSAASDKGCMLTAIFQQDFRYWAMTKALRRQFMELMGASPAVSQSLTTEQRRLADEVIDFMNPVSRRAAGTVFDNRAAMPNERIAGVRAPTLILHAKDDGLQLFHNAEFASRHIVNSRLVAFERGGHLLLAVEQPKLQRLVVEHISAHAGSDAYREEPCTAPAFAAARHFTKPCERCIR
ncbi:alpha/beta hydrolase [Paucibacter sp. B2R-40]|uniref:alpha/beta fold hydrolase n=1 Tax=Paucibacter sp. B2R-40 TaxID=2893554 RepID=UPI0021E51686|nr:alpha/beta hydrolase [Paucibacter sp. B2R-40]MCV2355610.1 alpha/beta hydrolase [Paucibacter sp. B2R-40]